MLVVWWTMSFLPASADGYTPPNRHKLLEYMARDIGYAGGRTQNRYDQRSTQKSLSPQQGLGGMVEGAIQNWAGDDAPNTMAIEGDPVFRKRLTAMGYKLEDSIDDGESGLQAMVVRNVETGQTTVIFRGTEPSQSSDVVSDSDASGDIGSSQYDKHKEKLAAWAKEYPGSYVTGHSLGAALGQRFVAENADKVKEGVFFNAPGIGKVHAHKFARVPKKPPVTIYVGSSKATGDPDLVSEAGGTSHLPSTVVEVENPEASHAGAHSFWMIGDSTNSFKELDYVDYQNRRVQSTTIIRETLKDDEFAYANALANFAKTIYDSAGFSGQGSAIDAVSDLINRQLEGSGGPEYATDKMEEAGKEAVSQSVTEEEEEKEEVEVAKLEEPTKPIEFDPFEIRATLNDYGGPPIEGRLAPNDTVAFEADVPLAGEPDKPVLTNLVWQVFGPDRVAVDTLRKGEQLAEEGGTENAQFLIRVADLPSGTYQVALVHQLAADPKIAAMAVSTFDYYQPIRITRMVVSDNPTAEPVLKTLYTHQSPHMLVYYSLAEDVKEVEVDLKVVEGRSAQVMHEFSGTKPRKEGPEQRAGLRLDPGFLEREGHYRFEATLSSGKHKTTDRTVFELTTYPLTIKVPNKVKTGQKVAYSIEPPGQFVPPFSIDLDSGSGLTLHHTSSFSGNLIGISVDDPKTTHLSAVVTDSEGRVARGRESILIEPKPKAPVVASTLPPSSSSALDKSQARWCWKQGLFGNTSAASKCRSLDAGVSYRGPLNCGGWSTYKKDPSAYYFAAYELGARTRRLKRTVLEGKARSMQLSGSYMNVDQALRSSLQDTARKKNCPP